MRSVVVSKYLFLLFFFFNLVACFELTPNQKTSLRKGETKVSQPTPVAGEPTPPKSSGTTTTQFAFLSVGTLKSIVNDQLEAGDAPVNFDGANSMTLNQFLDRNAANLGEPNLEAGQPGDPRVNATKAKLAYQILLEACAYGTRGPAKERVIKRLFPTLSARGWDAASFDQLYLIFFARRPTDDERKILLDLVGRIGEEKKAAAACGAALNTLEALGRSS